jgi:hypothetical protein
MKKKSLLLGLGVAALGVAAFASSADANSIYAPNPPTVTPVGTNFRWDYAIVVSQGSQVDSGDGFTIYDFGGFVGVSGSLPTGWALNSSNTNAPDYLTDTRASTDNPSITDLILTYTGGTQGSTLINTPLGTFSFISTSGTAVDSFFESKDHTIFNDVAQADDHNTQVPVGVPVPAAIWGGMTLLGAMFTAKVTRRGSK